MCPKVLPGQGQLKSREQNPQPALPGCLQSPKRHSSPLLLPEVKSRCEAGSSSEAPAAGSCPSCTGPCCRSPRSPHRTDSSTGAHLQSERAGTSGSSPPNPQPSFTCPRGQESARPEPERLQAGCHHTPRAFRVTPAPWGLLCTSGWPPSRRQGPVSPCPRGTDTFPRDTQRRLDLPSEQGTAAGSTAAGTCSLGREEPDPAPQPSTLLLLRCSPISLAETVPADSRALPLKERFHAGLEQPHIQPAATPSPAGKIFALLPIPGSLTTQSVSVKAASTSSTFRAPLPKFSLTMISSAFCFQSSSSSARGRKALTPARGTRPQHAHTWAGEHEPGRTSARRRSARRTRSMPTNRGTWNPLLSAHERGPEHVLQQVR